MTGKCVDLGFLDKCEPWLLINTFFPSKVGGRPAWLELENIPTNDRLQCTECGKHLAFLCQVYAPLDEFEICFHRTIYVFICLDSQCWKPNKSNTIKVLRCQLPRENKFYKPTPPSEDDPEDEILPNVKLCQVCGCRGTLSCSKCKSVNYCGKEHQLIDWTLGKHKISCGSKESSKIGDEQHKYLLEEFDLVTEQENEVPSQDTQDDDEADDEARRLKDYEEFLKKQKENTREDLLANVPDEEFDKYAGQIDDDEVFHKFKKQIAADPEQVVRFDREGAPLWITKNHQPDDNSIPVCERCQAPRTFEFQIMPQLLNSYKDLNVDWGVLAIYTCVKSCDTNGSYVDEYCYKQDLCEDDTQK